MQYVVDPHDPETDPAFYLNADLDPGSQTNADPDPVRLKSHFSFTLKHLK